MGSELRILAPLDGSKESQFILPLLAPLYRSRPVHLTLLGVVGRHERPASMDAYLETLRHGLVLQGVRADRKLEIGNPAGEILSMGRSGRFDLVAMTAHGKSGVRDFVPGSVAEEVIHAAELPILMSRPMGRCPLWDRFLVVLDGSAAAEAMLPDALHLARQFGVALQIVRPSTTAAPSMDRLQELCRSAASQGVRATAAALRETSPVEIIRHAEAEGHVILCRAAPGGTGLSRLAIGNTTELLLHGAPCALFVRHPGRAVA